MEALYPGQEEEGLSSFLGQCREMPTFWPFLAQTGYKRMADSQNFDLCVSVILSDRKFNIINQLFSNLIVHSFGNLPNMFSPGINKLDDRQKSIVQQHMESLGIKPDPSLSPNWFLQYPTKYRRLVLLFAQRLFPLLFNLCSPSPPIAPRDPAWEGLKRAVAHSLLQTEFPSSLVEHKDRLCGGRSYARGEIENFFAYPSDIELPGENSIQWCGGRQSRIQLWRDHVKACLAEMVSHNANILMTLVFPPEFSREGLGILRQGYINVVRKELRDAQDRDGNQKFGAEKLRVVIKLSREERGQVFRRVGDVMEYALRSDK
ncbi:MAG: hypothetical protein IPJ69_03535 [Deltaproteobacteria bacterium]|nr:MAG: hypothetical protein IPJ69_03535 [Deltaproteobacteria bacterium]